MANGHTMNMTDAEYDAYVAMRDRKIVAVMDHMDDAGHPCTWAMAKAIVERELSRVLPVA